MKKPAMWPGSVREVLLEMFSYVRGVLKATTDGATGTSPRHLCVYVLLALHIAPILAPRSIIAAFLAATITFPEGNSSCALSW